MGQFLSSTILEDSPRELWRDQLCDGEHKGAGEGILVHSNQVTYWGAWGLSALRPLGEGAG